MTIKFHKFSKKVECSDKAFKLLSKEISNYKKTNILIAGGNSLNHFFSFLIKKKMNMNKINFILSDERIVSEKSKYSNVNTIKNKFIKKIKKNNKPQFIYPSIKNRNEVNKKVYNNFKKKIKSKPSMAFLGVGNDGHIASIFFNDTKNEFKKSPFLICKRKIEKFRRISIDMKFLTKIPKIVIIIQDIKKRKILKKILNFKKQDINSPIMYLLNKSKKNIFILYNAKINKYE